MSLFLFPSTTRCGILSAKKLAICDWLSKTSHVRTQTEICFTGPAHKSNFLTS